MSGSNEKSDIDILLVNKFLKFVDYIIAIVRFSWL